MSEHWCRPTYRVPGVVYADDTGYNQGIGHSVWQSNKLTQQTNMSVRPSDDNADEGKTLNANTYATRKTIAQGMLDIALLTANASQLRYVLSLGPDRHENYAIMIGLIVTSLVLQLMVALLSLSMSMMRDCCIDNHEYKISALVINHFNVITVFLIATINIIMSAFGVYPTDVSLSPPVFP